MSKMTLKTYDFFKRHSALCYTIIIILFLLFGYFASQLSFQEDISKILPSDGKESKKELVFKELNVKERITVLFHYADETISDPDELSYLCDDFCSRLLLETEKDSSVKGIIYNLSDETVSNALQFLFTNLPIFIDTLYYPAIDSLLSKENINKAMQENYELMRSPAGSAYLPIISADPAALRNAIISKNQLSAQGISGMTLYNRHLFSPDKTVAIAHILPRVNSMETGKNDKLLRVIDNVIDTLKQNNPDIEISYHGYPVQSVFNSRQIKKDLVCTASIALLLIFIMILLSFKRLSTIPLMVLPVLFGSLFSLACIFFIKGEISLIALGIGSVVIGVNMSYCFHIITHYKYVDTPEDVVKDQTRPVFLGALTTIGSFAGLLVTKSELLRDFGLFASLSLAGTAAFCLLFMPQLLRPSHKNRSEKIFTGLAKINEYPFDQKKYIVAIVFVLCIICISFSGKIIFDSDLKNLGYYEPKVVESQDLINAKSTGGLKTTYFAVADENPDKTICYLKEVSMVLDSLKKTGIVADFSNSSKLLITNNEQQTRIDKWKSFWTPDKVSAVKLKISDAAKSYGFNEDTFTPFYELIQSDFSIGYYLDSNLLPQELTSTLVEKCNGNYVAFIPVQIEDDKIKEASDLVVASNKNAIVIDPFYYASKTVELINEDFSRTLYIAMLFVFVVLLVSYRNIILSLIAFMPMLLSWFMVLGIMSIANVEFNLINIVVSTFIFGIGVDYSIFIMDSLVTKYKTGRELAVPHKTAIIFSASTLIIGAGSLFFAIHPAVSSIGLATIAGMISTVIISYVIQPLLFKLYVRKFGINDKKQKSNVNK